MLYKNTELYERLKELEVVPQKALDKALKETEETKVPLHKTLLKYEILSDKNLGQLMADILGFQYVNLAKETIDMEVAEIVPELVARKYKAILYSRTDKGLNFAMANPSNIELPALIAKKTGESINILFATEKNIADNLAIYSKGLQHEFDALISKSIENAEKDIDMEENSSVEKIVATLIDYAFENKASDIHIEPEEEESIVRFRIDGVLHDVLKLPKELHDQVITRIKVLSKLRTDEHMSAQDGKMEIELERENLDIRVSIVPIVEGEKGVLRLLAESSRQFALQELGIRDTDLAKIRSAYERPHGMVLATGPTGSGKTTTIYAILKMVNTRNVNIATIEDPVEYDMEGINQIQVNSKTNLTFAHGLRAIMRQDPDIIFVGEIRDAETSGIAVNSAMTGHLVLSTLHTNDSATTLPRLTEMSVEPFLVATTVNVIVAQRLVRKVCTNCKISIEQDRTVFSKFLDESAITKHFGQGKKIRTYKGKGCTVCHDSGYDGRIGVFEVLEMTDALRELITQKENSEIIKNKAVEEGMTTMADDGLDKVARGETTLEEVMRVTRD